MNYTTLQVGDFELFSLTIRALARLVPSAKFVVGENGYKIFSKNSFARIETYSTVLKTPTGSPELSFCINDLTKLNKVLSSISREFDGEEVKLSIKVSDKNLSFESSKIKVKLVTVREETIENYIVQNAISTPLTPTFTFYTRSELIKNVNSNSFMFSDVDNIRIYLCDNLENMDNNMVYAKMSSVNSGFSNEIISKLGYITFGKIGDRNIIIDSERLAAFNIIDSDSIEISLMDKPFLVSKIHEEATKGGIIKDTLDINIYSSIRKN